MNLYSVDPLHPYFVLSINRLKFYYFTYLMNWLFCSSKKRRRNLSSRWCTIRCCLLYQVADECIIAYLSAKHRRPFKHSPRQKCCIAICQTVSIGNMALRTSFLVHTSTFTKPTVNESIFWAFVFVYFLLRKKSFTSDTENKTFCLTLLKIYSIEIFRNTTLVINIWRRFENWGGLW